MKVEKTQVPYNQKVDDFFVSGEVWQEVFDKIFPCMLTIRDNLEVSLQISDYSPVIKRYATFYNCHHFEQTAFHKPEDGWYSRKKKIVYQSFNLDYHQVEAISEKELLAIMAQKYLEGIPRIKTFWGMKEVPFNIEKFYQDAKQVFEKEGFYKEIFSEKV